MALATEWGKVKNIRKCGRLLCKHPVTSCSPSTAASLNLSPRPRHKLQRQPRNIPRPACVIHNNSALPVTIHLTIRKDWMLKNTEADYRNRPSHHKELLYGFKKKNGCSRNIITSCNQNEYMIVKMICLITINYEPCKTPVTNESNFLDFHRHFNYKSILVHQIKLNRNENKIVIINCSYY